MSGQGTFSGTSYQAGVIARVYVHMLAESRLLWFLDFDDTPTGVSAETGGPGDDARVEFGDQHPAIEVQAKHGLTAGTKLADAVRDIATRSKADDATRVVLAVDRTATAPIRIAFRRDLDRYRGSGEIGTELCRLRVDVGDAHPIFLRLFVVTVDADAGDEGVRATIGKLEALLEDPKDAPAAYDLLLADAHTLCTLKLRRARHELVRLLEGKNVKLRARDPFVREMSQLDISKGLLALDRADETLVVLDILETNMKGRDVARRLWYRLRQHRAAALLQLGRAEEALESVRLALDIDPVGVPALLTAAHANVLLGRLDDASALVERALAQAPEHAEVWSAKAQIDAMGGAPATSPPEAVERSASYQMALAQIAMNAGDMERVLAITRALYACGEHHPKTMLMLVSALAMLGEGAAPALHKEALRIATEAIDAAPDDDAVRAKLLALRADLRRDGGDTDGADADIAAIAEIDQRDPDARAHIAQAQLNAGRADYAVQTLTGAATAEHPMLLVLRAQANLRLDRAQDARRDLDLALATVGRAPEPDALRVYAAETALLLHDPDLADRLLDAVTGGGTAPEMRRVLRGRAAFERRDAAAMEEHFRAAAASAPRLTTKVLSELAQRLLRLGAAKEAVAVFEEIGRENLPAVLQPDYAAALVQTNALVQAASIVDAISASEQAPDWALHLASDLAGRRGDAERATELLGRVAARHPEDLPVAYEVARRLLVLRQASEAMPHIDRLLARADELDANQKMGVAHLLKEAGRREEAIALAFRAYRQAPHDAAMHRGLGGLLSLDPQPLPTPETVTAGTFVRLESEDGQVRGYVVYDDPPIDPLRGELLRSDAEKLGYIGRRVGDVITEGADTWAATRWTVREILPAIVYVFRDIMEHYEERFRTEPFFVRMIKLPDESSVKYLAPLLSSLHARRTQAETVYKAYRESTLPLGFVAGMLGISIGDAMHGAGVRDASLGPLAVEWFDAEGQEESRAAARSASAVILTRSALQTFADLALLESLREQFTWIAPRSLLDALERELRDAEEKCATGEHTLYAVETGLRASETAPGDAVLQARVDGARTRRDWVTANVRLEFRPLEMLERVDAQHEEARGTIGDHSLDAIELAEHLGATLVADDLGLRRFLPKGGPTRSCSTVSLLGALLERGVLDPSEHDRLILELVRRRYVAIMPSRSLLRASLHPTNVDRAIAAEAFALLAGPPMDLASAARIAAQVLRDTAVAALQFQPVATITRMALEALVVKWPAKLSVYALRAAVDSEFVLVPVARKEIRDTIEAFVKQRAV